MDDIRGDGGGRFSQFHGCSKRLTQNWSCGRCGAPCELGGVIRVGVVLVGLYLLCVVLLWRFVAVVVDVVVGLCLIVSLCVCVSELL